MNSVRVRFFPHTGSWCTRGPCPRRGDNYAAQGVGLHCRAGIGRSALVAACVLVLMGMAPGTAFDLIGKARGVRVPDTEGQREWVAKFREIATTGYTLAPETNIKPLKG
jgi:hypothetical protein